jgi:hypothetical protein
MPYNGINGFYKLHIFDIVFLMVLSYPTLFILEPQLGHAISLCSFPQFIQ